MSAGRVVRTGWLVKSPPEKKLKRDAWRKRWFVLRQGRMSGNPDVLEYYRNSHSKKPIRGIDLNECEVMKHSGPNFIPKKFQDNSIFVLKTTYRTFYLVAKSEAEMHIWMHRITQICHFGHLEGGTGSGDSLSHTTSSLQPSPAVSSRALRIVDPSFLAGPTAGDPDYLFLSSCETGKRSHGRCHSWSNSDRSLEQASSDDVFVDCMAFQRSLHLQPSSSLLQELTQPVTQRVILPRHSDTSGPPSSDFSSSSPLSGPPLTPTFLLDKSQSALSHGMTELDVLANTLPPRPPEPTCFSDRRAEEQLSGGLQNGHAGITGTQGALVPRRISISGLDSMRNWKADMEENSLRRRDKRLSLNLPRRFSPLYSCSSDSSENSYVPMHPIASPPASGADSTSDGYVPMRPGTATFTLLAGSTEKLSSPLPELPTDLEPPPVNRNLKPRRKARPPPLDLRNLSTIPELAALTRAWTVPYNRTSFISPERDGINSAPVFASSVSGDEEESYVQMEHRQATSPCKGAFPWPKKLSLDYFHSASPSPVQKPCRFSPLYSCSSDSSENSYMPMHPSASPPASGADSTSDDYVLMSPGTATFTLLAGSTEKLSSPLPELPTDLEPPPVNRNLKPRRKARPPPLDLRNLSTIPEHAALTRAWTVPYHRTRFISPERDGINSAPVFASSVSGDEEESYVQMEHRQATSPCKGAFPWPKKLSLDYFNSASPSPVQKKPLLSEEQRVDYVEVDELRTQALQKTKQEWRDKRQSKV